MGFLVMRRNEKENRNLSLHLQATRCPTFGVQFGFIYDGMTLEEVPKRIDVSVDDLLKLLNPNRPLRLYIFVVATTSY